MSDIFSPTELSALFTEIGEQLAAVHDDSAGALRALADIAAERVPGAMFAGITVGRSGGRFSTAAATNDLVRRTDVRVAGRPVRRRPPRQHDLQRG